MSDYSKSSIGNINKPLLGKLGGFETRLAANGDEIKAAQELRFKVFHEELSARSGRPQLLQKREFDDHDSNCDHLLVISEKGSNEKKIIGTQRFFIKRGKCSSSPFYSQQEFDVEALVDRHPDKVFMELGRSCILAAYRSKRTMELMWQGTWAYAVKNRVDVMIGCASFQANEVSEIETALGFLSKYAPVSSEWDAQSVGIGAVSMRPYEALVNDPRNAMKTLPPLVKGYLRLGAMFSTHAVPDPEFGTIDVLVVLPVQNISQRYLKYYGEDASKHQA